MELHGYTYQGVLEASEKINWRVEDLIGDGKQLDFTKPFLPESLARVKPLTFLTAREQLTLNQIRGNGYLYMFGLVEEFIVPYVLDHVRPLLHGDEVRVRALLEFAGEEAKHIHLFRRYREEFERGFGHRCDVIGPPSEIASAVLNHHPLAVALLIMHIEWMTQSHFIDSVRDDQALDPLFKNLLKHHWMEEAQHAKLDTLIVEGLAEACTPAEIERAGREYLEIGGFIDGGLQQLVVLDCENLVRATGCSLSEQERQEFMTVQLQANRYTFIGSGMTHPNFLGSVERLNPALRRQIEEVVPVFS
jgi:hypothetical protein